jgi:hypothetical protein
MTFTSWANVHFCSENSIFSFPSHFLALLHCFNSRYIWSLHKGSLFIQPNFFFGPFISATDLEQVSTSLHFVPIPSRCLPSTTPIVALKSRDHTPQSMTIWHLQKIISHGSPAKFNHNILSPTVYNGTNGTIEIPATRSQIAESEAFMHSLSISPSHLNRRGSRNSFGASLPIPKTKRQSGLSTFATADGRPTRLGMPSIQPSRHITSPGYVIGENCCCERHGVCFRS